MKRMPTDVQEMVRLVDEVAALRGEHKAKRYSLTEGLCKSIHADAWIWRLSAL